MAPPYADEDINAELTEQGMRVAENERRDSVTEAYESNAAEGPEAEDALDEIAYPESDPAEVSPEIAAIKEDFPTGQS